MGPKIIIFFSLVVLVLFQIRTNHAESTDPEQCDENQFYSPCGSPCEPTCDNPKPSCHTDVCLSARCQCEEGAVRNNEDCIPLDQCAKNKSVVSVTESSKRKSTPNPFWYWEPRLG